MPNKEYWKRRQEREAYNVFSEAEEEASKIAKLYWKAVKYLDGRAQRIFEKFKKKYGLSNAEAMRILKSAKDSASIDAAMQALENSPQSDDIVRLRQVVESAAFAARIERIKKLEENIDSVMARVYKQELAIHRVFYRRLLNESYLKGIFHIQQRAGVAFSFSDINPKLVDRVLHSKWSGENYSQRIWVNTQAVAEKAKEQVILGVLTGKTECEMSQALTEEFASGAKQSRKLIRTESNYIFTQADMAARKECDIRKYMYLATLDLKTCKDTCAKLDGKIFLVKDQKPGYNCPPMHPWCRCTTISIISDDWIKKQTRRARDPETGKTYKVPLSMTYEEWHDKYVKNNPKAALIEKKERNRRTDSQQYSRYKKILGSKVPDKLDDFQNIKYNDSEKWHDLQLAYKDQNLLNDIRKNYNLSINEGRQGKHIVGHNNYSGKSYLLPKINPQELVNKYAGTGKIIRARNRRWINRQMFMHNEQVGIVIDQNTKEEIPTRYFSIEYSKTKGTHIVPRKEPDNYDND